MSDDRPFLQIPCPNSDSWDKQQEYEKWLREKEEHEKDNDERVIVIEV